MRRTLEEFTDAVNARQFDKLLVLLDPRCLLLDEVSEMTEQWETLGDFVGDPDYRLEITSFDVKSQSGDSADIDMTAVMHTRRGTLPFGTPTDQVIDLMVRVDGKWRISDPECRDA